MMHQRGETALDFHFQDDRASKFMAHPEATHLGSLTRSPANNNTNEPGVTPPRRVRLQAPPRRPDPLVVTDTPAQRVGLAVAILIIAIGLLIAAPNPTIWP